MKKHFSPSSHDIIILTRNEASMFDTKGEGFFFCIKDDIFWNRKTLLVKFITDCDNWEVWPIFSKISADTSSQFISFFVYSGTIIFREGATSMKVYLRETSLCIRLLSAYTANTIWLNLLYQQSREGPTPTWGNKLLHYHIVSSFFKKLSLQVLYRVSQEKTDDSKSS